MAGKGVQLGFLKYVLGFDTLAFKKGISQADADLAAMQKRFAAKGKEFQSLGKSLTAFVTLPLAGIAAAGIKEAQETAAAMAQVNSALTSMGPVAGRTAKQLQDASNAFETKSLYEADQVLSQVTAKMLTFGNIAGTSFDQAQQAAVDLATRFGTDLGSAAVLVGKALNDPVKGLTALQRVGVSFTAQQREQIKAMVEAGNVAGAQAIILGELKREVGGAAEAAQNADPWNRLRDAFKSIAESVGTLLLPIIPPLANALASVAQWVTSLDPTTQKWVIGIAAAAAALGPLLIVLGNVITAVSAMGPLVLALTKGWGLLSTTFTLLGPIIATVGRALLGLLANPILLGAAVLITGIYLAWKHWDEISAIAQRVYTGVKTWLLDKLTAIVGLIKTKVIQPIHDSFAWLGEKLVFHSIWPDTVIAIGVWAQKLPGLMVTPAKQAADGVKDAFSGLGPSLFPVGADGVDPLAPLTAAAQSVTATNDNVAESAKMTSAEVVKAYGDMAAGVIGNLRSMVDQIKHGDILGALQTILGMVTSVIDVLGRTGIIKPSASALPYRGARAMGGPVVPGKSYLVGENGPEFVSFGSKGYVAPPKGGGSQARVTIVPSKYFDAVVDQRSASVAAPMAGQAAVAGASGAMSGIAQRQRRQLP